MVQQRYYYGLGRRKSAIARVRIMPGTGRLLVNGKPMEEIFVREVWQRQITGPLQVTDSLGHFDMSVKVVGGGTSGWAGAISQGVARALVVANEELRPLLRHEGFLSRDPRVKERKKYGLKRARKAPQYTKR
ncbi:MAG: 30S ribosomal protein S9 [Chloroflexi bacterium]|nr:30S ribosomal protein S9 [Chloroflexota bacterium]